MKFLFCPTVEAMLKLYQQKPTLLRFQNYLNMLEGDSKGSFQMPISAYNPMAQEHLIGNLQQLKNLNAEEYTENVLEELNQKLKDQHRGVNIKLALNVSDDLLGGWTNRYSSDYNNKFDIGGLVNKQFCIAVLWSSEVFDLALIEERVKESAYRTVYRLDHKKPDTLRDHVQQEKFIVSQTPEITRAVLNDVKFAEDYFQSHKSDSNSARIFNFLYGDKASESMAMPVYGVNEDFCGFKFAASFEVTQ